jgi:WD40 repeat protein
VSSNRQVCVVGAALLLFGVSSSAAPGAKPNSAARKTAGPRAAIAYSPDGKRLAVAGHREVLLIDAATRRVTGTLKGHEGEVTCVAFSPKGDTLAASSGVPGRSGEIRLWNLASRSSRSLTGVHTDVVYSVAWSPDGKTLAAGSYDRLVSLWDTGSGKGRALKDHTDAVYSVAFSHDGTRVASASGDRTVKLWDPLTGRRLFTLSESTAELYSVAFRPGSSEIAAAGVDRMLRKWTLTRAAGTLSGSAFAHDGPVIRLAYLPDGSGLVTASEDRSLRLWDAVTLTEKKIFPPQSDWPLGLATSPSGNQVAVSLYNGAAVTFDVATGQRTALLGP